MEVSRGIGGVNNVELEVLSSEFDKMSAEQTGEKSRVSLDQMLNASPEVLSSMLLGINAPARSGVPPLPKPSFHPQRQKCRQPGGDY